jgi:formyl-CoA transferase
LASFAAAGIPAGRVRTIDEVYKWEQTRSQHLLMQVDHPTLGPVTLPGSPLRFTGGNGREHDVPAGAPPRLGEHDAAVRSWLGQGGDEA